MELKDIKDCIRSNGSGKYRIVDYNGSVIYRRLFISVYGSLCEFSKRSRSRGHEVYDYDSWRKIELVKIDDIKCIRSFLKNTIKYLSVSGLWRDMKKNFEILLTQDDQFFKQYLEYYWEFNDKAKKLLNSVGVTDKYCDNLLYSARKGIVTINYNTYEKEDIRGRILSHLKECTDYQYRWRKGYDNSVSYVCKDGEMYGWYNTEFIGCGNGHYYFALDEKHAIFCEDD